MTFIICATAISYSADIPIGTIIGVSGTGAKVVIAGTDHQVDATPQKKLHEGDTIITPKGAIVSILMADSSEVKVNQLSRLKIEKKNGERAPLALHKGGAWAKVSSAEQKFEVRTPTAVAGVRGTELNISVDDGEQKSTLTIIEGEASFSNEYGSVDVGSGQQSSAVPGQAPSTPIQVDTRFFIEWTADVEAIGAAIETPLVSPNRYVLQDLLPSATEKVMGKSPGADDYAYLASIYYDLGDFEIAEKYFNRAMEKEMTVKTVYGWGITLVRLGRSEEAAEFFRKALEKKKDVPEYNTGLGLALLKHNDVAGASAAFDAALSADPASCLSLTGKSIIAMRSASFDEAGEYLKKATGLEKRCFQAESKLAELKLSMNDIDGALAIARETADVQTFSPGAQATLAKILFFKGDYPEAKKAAAAAVELDEFHSEAHDVLAMIAVGEGQINTAVREALAAIALDPNNAHAHDVLATAYMLKRKRDGAIVHWERAVEVQPDFVPAHLNISRLFNTIYKPEKAEEHARAALKVDPENDRALGELGRSMELQRRFPEAEESYKKAIDINPKYAKTHARLATFYMDRFDLKKALQEANKAVVVEPYNPAGYVASGLIHDELDNTESARLNYTAALKLNPDDAEARYRLGIILGQENGRAYEALSEMRRAELLEPTVIVREDLRDNVRFSSIVGDDNYFNNTLAATGYGFNRNMIFKLRLSGTKDDYSRKPEFPGYDDILNSTPVSPDENSAFGRSLTFLLNYRPDYYQSFIMLFDSDDSGEGWPGSALNRMKYKFSGYKRVELNYRKILGPKSSYTLHVGHTGTRSDSLDYYTAAGGALSFSNKDYLKYRYTEFEAMYETKYCKFCITKVGASLWDTNTRNLRYNFMSPDNITWTKVLSSAAKEGGREQIFYVDNEFTPIERLKVKVSGEKVDRNHVGARDTGEFTILYGLKKPAIGIYYREGQKWYLVSAEGLRPADSYAYLQRYDEGIPGRYMYRELAFDGKITNSTYFRTTFYEQKRKSYTLASNYHTVASQVDEEGRVFNLEQQLGGRANINFKYTSRDLINPAGNTVVPMEPLYSSETGLHWFMGRKWHSRFTHTAGSSFLDSTGTRYVSGYNTSDLLLYFEPGIKQRFYLQVGNLFGQDIPDMRNAIEDDSSSFKLGADIWF